MAQDKNMARTIGFVRGSLTERICKFIFVKRVVSSEDIYEEWLDCEEQKQRAGV